MDPALIERFAAPVPRYTSYPTAPHFSTDVGPEQYAAWLERLPSGAALSIYAHIPFCDTLCWYCGCTTKATRRTGPVKAYVESLLAEIALVARHLPRSRTAAHVHWGGGSPSILAPGDIGRLAAAIYEAFHLASGAEFAVEVDPRGLDEERVQAFAAAGVNRASFGVQDFAPAVQKAINREQSFEVTARAIELFRCAGVEGINIDLVYGLPHQSCATLEETLEQVIALAPDRIALFGYAHLPSRLPHQRMIEDAALPGPQERYAQASLAAERLQAAGYRRVGLDHFARPQDALASKPVHRNFQGYTTDSADALIGLGASAIGRLPQGYVQNATVTADYQRRIGDSRLATARGRALTEEDKARGLVIERLMCNLAFPAGELRAQYPAQAEQLLAEAQALVTHDADGLVSADVGDAGFRVTEKGRPFVRSLCAAFDTYLGQGAARHASGI